MLFSIAAIPIYIPTKNGTYVGAERVTAPRVLADGDEIRIGPVTVTFRAAPTGRSTATVL